MDCANCGHTNSPRYRYCEVCGEARNANLPASHASLWRRRFAVVLLTLYPLLLVALTLVNILQPRRAGLLALSEVFAPYLYLPLVLLAPFALMRGTRLLRVMLLVCVVLFCVRFPPRLLAAAPASTPGALHLSTMQWNVMFGGQYDQMLNVLRTKPATIISMVEADWNRLSQDPEVASLYPYMWGVEKDGPVSGQVLLTTYPIIDQGVLDSPQDLWAVPRVVWARLDVGLGRNVVVVVAHPPPGRFCGHNTFPRQCYDTVRRDRQLAAINAFVQPYLTAGDALLLLGDFNVTEREPAYDDLSAGLLDTHRVVGLGTGVTWRPASLMDKNFGLLRIDYIFTSPDIKPLSTRVDCTPRGSDHCILQADVEIP